ncbi:MAG: hypothetical protein J7M19_05285 [Planctomycetes bacterium]|nr:hypothetical protein [Planctomycetota bacterium]
MHGITDPRDLPAPRLRQAGMSADEIFQEVAALLARGYMRLKKRTPHLADALAEAEAAREWPPEEPWEFRETGLDIEAD